MKKIVMLMSSAVLASANASDFDGVFFGVGVGHLHLNNSFKDFDPNEVKLKDKKACNVMLTTFSGIGGQSGGLYGSIELFLDFGKNIKKKTLFENGEDHNIFSKTIGYSFGPLGRVGYAFNKNLLYFGAGASFNQHDLSNGSCLRSRRMLPIVALGYERKITDGLSIRTELSKKFPQKKRFDVLDVKTNYGLTFKVAVVKYI